MRDLPLRVITKGQKPPRCLEPDPSLIYTMYEKNGWDMIINAVLVISVILLIALPMAMLLYVLFGYYGMVAK